MAEQNDFDALLNDVPALNGYVLAASVLDTFDPNRIRPLPFEDEPGTKGSPLSALLAQSVVMQTGYNRYEWRLEDETRRRALKEVIERNLLDSAIRLNGDARNPDNPYQRMFEAYVYSENIPRPEQQSLEELQASLQAVRLLRDMIPNLPPEREIEAYVQRESFLQQFRVLADAHYFGRQKEFEKLERFVDTLPTTRLHAARRAVKSIASSIAESLAHERPLLVKGPGGIGKSSFLAKFFLAHVEGTQARNLVFAYLDFDRVALWAEEPLTLLAEIAGQMAAQATRDADRFTELQHYLTRELAQTQGYGANYDSYESIRNLSMQVSREQRYLEWFRELISHGFEKGRRVTLLVVFDTIEEVTQRGQPHFSTFWQFILQLQQILPNVRVVMSGRTDLPKEVKHEKLDLPPIDDAAARDFLRSYGIESEAVIRKIRDRVGGHPLGLRLTVQLLQTLAANLQRPLDEVAIGEVFSRQWEEHLADGILYRRIVHHISDPVIRKLTNPGFVLREVTPSVILDVLNEPCELGIRSLTEAKEVFARLANFNSLVSQRSDWILRHRPEVRSLILETMLATQLDLCKRIWRNAVAHYSDNESIRYRAEEIYCRMMLGQDPEQISSRWKPGVERYLLTSRQELPEPAQLLLDFYALRSASGTSGVSGTLVSSADDVHALRLAEELKFLLAHGRARQALESYFNFAGNTPPDPRSPLYVLVARAYFQSGSTDSARTMAEDGLAALERWGLTGVEAYVDLLLLLTQIFLADDTGSYFFSRVKSAEHASKLWRRLRHVPKVSERRIQAFRVSVHILALFNAADSGSGSSFFDVAIRLPARSTVPPGLVRDPLPIDDADLRGCVLDVLEDVRFLDMKGEGIDGILLLRAFALLGRYFPDDYAVRSLLSVESAYFALKNEFATVAQQISMKPEEATPGESDQGPGFSELLLHAPLHAVRDLVLNNSLCTDRDIYLLAYYLRKDFAERDSMRHVPLA